MEELQSCVESLRLNASAHEAADAVPPATPASTAKGEAAGSVDGPDELTCAICLEQIDPVDMAVIKGCEHLYCVHCILQWAMCKEVARCPQCKAPFTFLFCHRMLDGTVMDFPVEEPIVLLKRAKWFEDHLKSTEKGQAILAAASHGERLDAGAASSSTGHDWRSEFQEDFEDEADEDEEIEQFYFSSAAGRARVFGNRRLGENGFLKSGRMYARPAQPVAIPQPAGKGKGKKGTPRTPNQGGGSGALGASPPSGRQAVAAPSQASSSGVALEHGSSSGEVAAVASTPSGKAAARSAAGDDAAAYSGSGGKQGRRAKRNARRSAVDNDDYYDGY